MDSDSNDVQILTEDTTALTGDSSSATDNTTSTSSSEEELDCHFHAGVE